MKRSMTQILFATSIVAVAPSCGGDDSESETGAEGFESAESTGELSESSSDEQGGPEACQDLSRGDCFARMGCTWEGGFNGTCQPANGDADDGDADDDDPAMEGPSTRDCGEVSTPFVCMTTIGCAWENETCIPG